MSSPSRRLRSIGQPVKTGDSPRQQSDYTILRQLPPLSPQTRKRRVTLDSRLNLVNSFDHDAPPSSPTPPKVQIALPSISIPTNQSYSYQSRPDHISYDSYECRSSFHQPVSCRLSTLCRQSSGRLTNRRTCCCHCSCSLQLGKENIAHTPRLYNEPMPVCGSPPPPLVNRPRLRCDQMDSCRLKSPLSPPPLSFYFCGDGGGGEQTPRQFFPEAFSRVDRDSNYGPPKRCASQTAVYTPRPVNLRSSQGSSSDISYRRTMSLSNPPPPRSNYSAHRERLRKEKEQELMRQRLQSQQRHRQLAASTSGLHERHSMHRRQQYSHQQNNTLGGPPSSSGYPQQQRYRSLSAVNTGGESIEEVETIFLQPIGSGVRDIDSKTGSLRTLARGPGGSMSEVHKPDFVSSDHTRSLSPGPYHYRHPNVIHGDNLSPLQHYRPDELIRQQTPPTASSQDSLDFDRTYRLSDWLKENKYSNLIRSKTIKPRSDFNGTESYRGGATTNLPLDKSTDRAVKRQSSDVRHMSSVKKSADMNRVVVELIQKQRTMRPYRTPEVSNADIGDRDSSNNYVILPTTRIIPPGIHRTDMTTNGRSELAKRGFSSTQFLNRDPPNSNLNRSNIAHQSQIIQKKSTQQHSNPQSAFSVQQINSSSNNRFNGSQSRLSTNSSTIRAGSTITPTLQHNQPPGWSTSRSEMVTANKASSLATTPVARTPIGGHGHESDIRAARETANQWYRPKLSREEAIRFLRRQPPGSFLIRDSTTYKDAFGLAVKVSKLPPKVVPKSTDMDAELVRHYLIEAVSQPTRGVRLKGFPIEPIFPSLAALIHRHTIEQLALPCPLILPQSVSGVGGVQDPSSRMSDIVVGSNTMTIPVIRQDVASDGSRRPLSSNGVASSSLPANDSRLSHPTTNGMAPTSTTPSSMTFTEQDYHHQNQPVDSQPTFQAYTGTSNNNTNSSLGPTHSDFGGTEGNEFAYNWSSETNPNQHINVAGR